MEEREIKLTTDVYESTVNALVSDILRLKKQQGETIDRISIEKEALIAFKKQLKQLKSNSRLSKKTLKNQKRELEIINDTLNNRNHSITELNYAITAEEERTIDLNDYSVEQPKRR